MFDVVLQDFHTFLETIVDRLGQPSIHGIVCAKHEHGELLARLEHVWKPHFVVLEHGGKMLLAMRTRDGITKHVEPCSK